MRALRCVAAQRYATECHDATSLVELFRPNEVVCDMMAGIGPFAVPAGRRRVVVHANDLNPRCAHYLRINARLNKVRAAPAAHQARLPGA